MDTENVKRLCNELSEMLEKKNKNYGNSFGDLTKKYGEFPFLIHAEEKLNRIKSTAADGYSFESTVDSLLDLAGYCVLYADILTSGEK